MSSTRKYDYENKESIDPDLICAVCNEPFENPKSLPCSHVFCDTCIKQNSAVNRITCSICKNSVSEADLEEVNRPLLNMLQRLQIKCTHCGQTGLDRGTFNEHVKNICLKTNVACSAADIECPWLGSRDQLDGHLATCAYQLLRPKLTELIGANRKLKEQTDKKIDQLQNDIEQKKVRIDALEHENQELKKKINQLKSCDKCRRKACENGRVNNEAGI